MTYIPECEQLSNDPKHYCEACREYVALRAEVTKLRADIAAEREACAKVCEREQTPDEPYYQYDAGYEDGVKDCAAAIRARGEK